MLEWVIILKLLWKEMVCLFSQPLLPSLCPLFKGLLWDGYSRHSQVTLLFGFSCISCFGYAGTQVTWLKISFLCLKRPDDTVMGLFHSMKMEGKYTHFISHFSQCFSLISDPSWRREWVTQVFRSKWKLEPPEYASHISCFGYGG